MIKLIRCNPPPESLLEELEEEEEEGAGAGEGVTGDGAVDMPVDDSLVEQKEEDEVKEAVAQPEETKTEM